MKEKRKIFILQLSIAVCILTVTVIVILSFASVRAYIQDYRDDIVYLTAEQFKIFLFSAGFSVFTAFICGYFLSKPYLRRYANFIMQIFNIGMAVPALALLALCMLAFGLGLLSSLTALILITLMPIVRGTYTAFIRLDPDQLEAGRAMGMSPWQVFSRVEFPQALPLIFAGVRSGIAFNVGSLPLVFLIGTSSLGELIFVGLRLNDTAAVLIGSALTALMAVALDTAVHIVSRFSVSKGL